jgi:hypothetical protein
MPQEPKRVLDFMLADSTLRQAAIKTYLQLKLTFLYYYLFLKYDAMFGLV